jgi:hypothetical protein
MRASPLIVIASGIACALIACGSSSRTFSWTGGVECRGGDSACREVERHIAEMLTEKGAFRRTVWSLIKMGGRAVPTLRRELHSESVMHVKVAVYVLTAMGRGEEVDAWCVTLDREGRDLICLPGAERISGDGAIVLPPEDAAIEIHE